MPALDNEHPFHLPSIGLEYITDTSWEVAFRLSPVVLSWNPLVLLCPCQQTDRWTVLALPLHLPLCAKLLTEPTPLGLIYRWVSYSLWDLSGLSNPALFVWCTGEYHIAGILSVQSHGIERSGKGKEKCANTSTFTNLLLCDWAIRANELAFIPSSI